MPAPAAVAPRVQPAPVAEAPAKAPAKAPVPEVALADDAPDWNAAPAMDDLPPWEALDEAPPAADMAPGPELRSLPVREASPAAASRTEVLKRPEAPLQPTPEGDFWAEMVAQLQTSEAITALVRELALQSQLLAREEGVWRLRVASESLNMASTRERLQAALHAAGHAVRLQVELGEVSDSPAKRNAQAAAAKMQAAQDLIHNDPLVQSLMRDWGARIVPGSIQPL